VLEDKHGRIIHAAIRTYGDTIHSFVERKGYSGSYWPGFIPYEVAFPGSLPVNEAGIKVIDHVVGNVELGKMDEWVGFYEQVLGFSQLKHFSDKDISTEYSALMSKVMNGGTGKIKLPINEPAQGKRKSQIEEYLDFHNGPGVQHVAFATDDIISTVTALRARGVRFLFVPKRYYDEAPARVGEIKEDLQRIKDLGILVDRDEDGYLLQIFTKPLQDRPTMFFEIIQREGSRGFGAGNFKALFEAIERDQAERGNL
jgi:4-hydroxyphenylpyruvate dioxygenase